MTTQQQPRTGASSSVVVRHNAEAAHRLPFLEGKCQSIHGHSWWFEVTVAGVADDNGVVLEYAELKSFVRGWIDNFLDHGAMLGAEDPLAGVLAQHGCKVFVFDPDGNAFCMGGPDTPMGRALKWPTVENVAELVRRVVVLHLAETIARPFHVRVQVNETHVNQAVAW